MTANAYDCERYEGQFMGEFKSLEFDAHGNCNLKLKILHYQHHILCPLDVVDVERNGIFYTEEFCRDYQFDFIMSGYLVRQANSQRIIFDY